VQGESDESTNKEDNQQGGQDSSGLQSRVEMARPCGKKGPVRWAQVICKWCVDIGNRELGDRWPDGQTRSRGWQEDGCHEQPKTGANAANTTFVKRESHKVRSHK
jgi:hypothetical protein